MDLCLLCLCRSPASSSYCWQKWQWEGRLNQPLQVLATTSTFLPSSTVRLTSPNLQCEHSTLTPGAAKNSVSLTLLRCQDWLCHYIQCYWNDYKHTWPFLASTLHKTCWQLGKDLGRSWKKDSESGKDVLKQEPGVIQSIYLHKDKVQDGLITVHKYLHYWKTFNKGHNKTESWKMELWDKIQAKNEGEVLEMNAIKSLEPFTFACSKFAII